MNEYTIHPTNDKLLRVPTVAQRLDISRMSVYRLFHYGKLKGLRTSPRNIRIYESSIRTYLHKLNPPEDREGC